VEPVRLADRHVAVVLRLLVVAVVVLRRFAVPGIRRSRDRNRALPSVVLAIVACLVLQDALVHDALRFGLYPLAVGSCCAATSLSAEYFKDEWSLNHWCCWSSCTFPSSCACGRSSATCTAAVRVLQHNHGRDRLRGAAAWSAQVAGWPTATCWMSFRRISSLGVRRGPAWTARILFLLLLTGPAVQSIPLGGILAARLTERTEQNSSGNARFVAPYMLVTAGLTKDIPTLLVGRDPALCPARPAQSTSMRRESRQIIQ
jgi:hypothetical protein